MSSKKVTIGMPVYNDLAFIDQSLNAILKQTFQDFKLIISDDQSTDGSSEVCKRFKIKDLRVEYVRQEKNIGISKNMEFLLNKADTDYFIWAADDDVWHPEFLEKLVRGLDSDKESIVAFSTFIHIDENNNPLSEPLDYNYRDNSAYSRIKKIIRNPFDAFGYGLFRREAIKKVKFPTWSWPNRHVSYNNIYPTLCYYLCLGNYVHIEGEPLFFNRVKNTPNHSKVRVKNKWVVFVQLALRKFELTFASIKQIVKAKKYGIAIKVCLLMLKKWTIVPIYYELRYLIRSKK